MKKLFVAALLVVGITAFAQEKEGRKSGKERLTTEQKVEIQVKKMSKDLDLNDKQKEQVKAMVTAEVQKREQKRKEMQDAKEKGRAEMRAQIQTNQAAITSEMKKILTAEQFAKWEKMRDERKANRKEKIAEKRKTKDLD